MALAAGIMPDTFLDTPGTTIRYETAFVIRHLLILLAFGYVVLAAIARLSLRFPYTSAREPQSPENRFPREIQN